MYHYTLSSIFVSDRVTSMSGRKKIFKNHLFAISLQMGCFIERLYKHSEISKHSWGYFKFHGGFCFGQQLSKEESVPRTDEHQFTFQGTRSEIAGVL